MTKKMDAQKGKTIYLLDRSLKVEVYYEPEDSEFADNICISFCEECPDNERLFIADETNIFLSCDQSKLLAEALLEAVQKSCASSTNQK